MRTALMLALIMGCGTDDPPVEPPECCATCACADDPEATFEAVWEDIFVQGASAPGQEYFLTYVPILGGLTVSIRDDGISYVFIEDEDWIYNTNRNSVRFIEYVPSSGAEITARYLIAP